MKKAKIAVALLILAGVGIGAWLWFSSTKSTSLVLYGNVDQRQVELAFIDSERIEEILAQEGDEVQPGQILARLETRRLRDQIAVAEAQVETADAVLTRLKNGTRPEEIDQARASVASAKAELAFAETQYKRFVALWEHPAGRAASKQDVDEALMQRNVSHAKLDVERKSLRLAEIGPRVEDIVEAEATLLEHQRTLERLRNQLDDAELKSPSHSVVYRRLMEPGDMASPQKAVFSLAVISPKWVRAYISETDVGRVWQGMRAIVYTDSHPDDGISGKIGFISSVAEFTPKAVETPELRTSLVYEVRVYVEDSQNRLRLGIPATVYFPEASAKPRNTENTGSRV